MNQLLIFNGWGRYGAWVVDKGIKTNDVYKYRIIRTLVTDYINDTNYIHVIDVEFDSIYILVPDCKLNRALYVRNK